jgi:amino acid transporter
VNNRNKIAFAIYLIVSISTICLGLVYLFSPMFMPYHREILGKNWDDLEKPNQMLLLALMKGMGAGLIGIGVLIIFLLFYPFRDGEKWVRFALPIAGLILYVISVVSQC